MADGVAVFHATHKNLIAAGTAIDETNVSAMRQLMRAQRGVDGQIYINAVPRYLLVGIARETSAEKLVTSITPAVSSAVNVFAGRFEVVVDPRITGSPEPWYLVADPTQIDGLE